MLRSGTRDVPAFAIAFGRARFGLVRRAPTRRRWARSSERLLLRVLEGSRWAGPVRVVCITSPL